MRLVTFQSVLERTCQLIGTLYANLSAEDQASVLGFINHGTKQAWEFYWWPELMLSELRFYRADYAAGTTYAAGAEVYYPTTALYYVALGTTTGNAPTNATFWAVVTDIVATIDLAQAGKTVIGEVRMVAQRDPLSDRCPGKLRFNLGPAGIYVLGCTVPTSVYVWFRIPNPDFTGTAFDPAVVYTAGAQKYYTSATPGFEGDYWVANATTIAAESPETTPAKWDKVQFPKILREAVAREAHYRYLVKDGATIETLGLATADATAALIQEMHKIVGQQSQAGR